MMQSQITKDAFDPSENEADSLHSEMQAIGITRFLANTYVTDGQAFACLAAAIVHAASAESIKMIDDS